jgi:hypothetical protein
MAAGIKEGSDTDSETRHTNPVASVIAELPHPLSFSLPPERPIWHSNTSMHATGSTSQDVAQPNHRQIYQAHEDRHVSLQSCVSR